MVHFHPWACVAFQRVERGERDKKFVHSTIRPEKPNYNCNCSLSDAKDAVSLANSPLNCLPGNFSLAKIQSDIDDIVRGIAPGRHHILSVTASNT